MIEKIYRAMKKATLPRRQESYKFPGMKEILVEKRGENALMVATDGKIMVRVDYPRTKLRRKAVKPAGFPHWEDPAFWPEGGVSACFDLARLRTILDIAEAVHGPDKRIIRLTISGSKDKAAKIETADTRIFGRAPRMTALIMPVVL